jgi:hypothetical protein
LIMRFAVQEPCWRIEVFPHFSRHPGPKWRYAFAKRPHRAITAAGHSMGNTVNPPPPDTGPNPSTGQSVPSQSPVQVVNVYSGAASEQERNGLFEWLKEKIEELARGATGTTPGRGNHRGKPQLQPLITNSVLLLILIVTLAQFGFELYNAPKEVRQDDGEERQLLTTVLTALAAESRANSTVPAAPQGDSVPKIVVMPITVPSPASTQPQIAPEAPVRVQFEPAQVEVRVKAETGETGGSAGKEPNPPEKLIELPSTKSINITTWFDADFRCKSPLDGHQPFLHMGYRNIGNTIVWIDAIKYSNLTSTPEPMSQDCDSTAQSSSEKDVIYPSETRMETLNCDGSWVSDGKNHSALSGKAPGYLSLCVKYHLKYGLKPNESPHFVDRATFYLSPPNPPDRVTEGSFIQSQ